RVEWSPSGGARTRTARLRRARGARGTTRRARARRHEGISLRDATGPGHATRGKPAGRRGIAGVGSGAPAVEADGATGFATVNVHGGGSRDAAGWSLAGCDAAGIQPRTASPPWDGSLPRPTRRTPQHGASATNEYGASPRSLPTTARHAPGASTSPLFHVFCG